MLKQRIVTAILLLALLIPALFYRNPLPFAALTLALMMAAAWEWGRLNSPHTASRWVLVAVTLALCLIGAQSLNWTPNLSNFYYSTIGAQSDALQLDGKQGAALGRPLWLAMALLWLVGAPLALKRGLDAWAKLPSGLRLLLGTWILSAAWLALLQLRLIGMNTLLSCMVLVWVADTGAYAAGKKFGKTKLAPSISPGKSWQGVAGGAIAVAALAALWLWLDRYALESKSLYTLLKDKWGYGPMAGGVALLLGMSVVGDLFESLMKRVAGMKDSSNLLPGHGGVLDRIDALLPTFVLTMLLLSL